MIRATRLFALLMLTASALGFSGAFYLASDWNWTPVKLPAPGPGLSVEEIFDITTPGKFRLEASVPTSAGTALENLPVVISDLEVAVERRGTAPRTYFVKQFRAGARGATDSYSSETELNLQRGTYALRVRNRGTAQPFGDRGALLSFTRFVHPKEFYLQGVLLRGIGWFGLVGGVLLGAIGERFSPKLSQQSRA